jgi:hypothetical protein
MMGLWLPGECWKWCCSSFSGRSISVCCHFAVTKMGTAAGVVPQVLCALASDGSRRRAWLLGSGILPLLQRLTVERGRDVADLQPAAGEYVEGGIPLCIERQAVRLLAMLAGDQHGAAAVQDSGWVPWLQALAVSTDLKLSSCASRALLHIESAAATQRTGLDISLFAAERRLPPLHAGPAPLLPSEQQGAAAAAAAAAATAADAGGSSGQEARSPGVEAAEAAAEIIGDARLALAQVRRRLDRQLDIVRPAVPPQHRLVMLDGVHLFDPLATHHEVLAREGVAADTAGVCEPHTHCVHSLLLLTALMVVINRA